MGLRGQGHHPDSSYPINKRIIYFIKQSKTPLRVKVMGTLKNSGGQQTHIREQQPRTCGLFDYKDTPIRGGSPQGALGGQWAAQEMADT